MTDAAPCFIQIGNTGGLDISASEQLAHACRIWVGIFEFGRWWQRWHFSSQNYMRGASVSRSISSEPACYNFSLASLPKLNHTHLVSTSLLELIQSHYAVQIGVGTCRWRFGRQCYSPPGCYRGTYTHISNSTSFLLVVF